MDLLVKQPSNDDTLTVNRLKAAWQQAEDRWLTFRKKQIRNYEYVVLNMIDKEIRKTLNEQRLPVYEIDLLNQPLQFTAGMLKRDATKVKAVPTHQGAESLSFLHTVLTSDWAMGNCSGYNEIARSGIDAWIGGFGATNNYWTTKFDPEGEWITESVDPFAVGFDPETRKMDFGEKGDCRYIWYSKMYSADEIQQIYARYLDDATKQELKDQAERFEGSSVRRVGKPISWIDRGVNFLKSMFGVENTIATQGVQNDFVDALNGLYRVVEWHDKRMEDHFLDYNPLTRESKRIDTHPGTESYVDEGGQPHVIQTIPEEVVYITAVCPTLLPSKPLFERPHPIQGRGFQIKFVFAYNWHPDMTRLKSGVDGLVGLADLMNQSLMSQVQAILDFNNPPIDVPLGSLDVETRPGWLSRERGRLREYTPFGGLKPEEKRPDGNIVKMFASLGQQSQMLFEQTHGISPNARGFRQGGREGARLDQQRSQKAEVMTAHFIDNMQEYMRSIFRYCDKALQVYLTTERSVRITSDSDDPRWLMVNQKTLEGIKNDVSQGDYDFRPDMETLGETARKEQVAMLAQLLQMGIDDPIESAMLRAAIYKYNDVPDVKRIGKYLEMKTGVLQDDEIQAVKMREVQRKMAVAGAAAELHGKVHGQPQPQSQQKKVA